MPLFRVDLVGTKRRLAEFCRTVARDVLAPRARTLAAWCRHRFPVAKAGKAAPAVARQVIARHFAPAIRTLLAGLRKNVDGCRRWVRARRPRAALRVATGHLADFARRTSDIARRFAGTAHGVAVTVSKSTANTMRRPIRAPGSPVRRLPLSRPLRAAFAGPSVASKVIRFGAYVALVSVLATGVAWSFAELLGSAVSLVEQHIGPVQAGGETRAATVSAADARGAPGDVSSTRNEQSPRSTVVPVPTRMAVANWYAPQAPTAKNRDPDDDDRDREIAERPPLFSTFCVRLCDGYYWPLNHMTTSGSFGRDSERCERACPGAPVRLFVNPTPGGVPELMRDLSGTPYSRLKTAFAFQTAYDTSCRCTAQPWDQEAQNRHRVYALEAAQRKGDTSATSELTTLRAKVEADRRSLATQSRAINDRLIATKVLTPKGGVIRDPNAREMLTSNRGPMDIDGRMGLGAPPEESRSRQSGSSGSRAWIERVFSGGN